MVHHLTQIVSKNVFIAILLAGALFSKEVPIMKTVTINIPLKEYSIVEFPFKIIDIQAKSFVYRSKVKRKIKKSEIKKYKSKGISLSKSSTKTPIKSPIGSEKDILGLDKGVNVLTFKPKFTGYTEMIIWGYSDFPIIIKINVVEANKADKYIKFKDILNKSKEVKKFESSTHEKIIEKITQHLYDEHYESKPIGYESIVRKDIYDVEVKNRDNKVVAIFRSSLIREIIGRDYLGQVWNVNLVGFKEDVFFGLMEEEHIVSEDLELNLNEEMFDEKGIFGISLETYSITKKHGTRVMIVRSRD